MKTKCDQCENSFLKGIHTCDKYKPRNDAVALVVDGKTVKEVDMNISSFDVAALNILLIGVLPANTKLKHISRRRYESFDYGDVRRVK